MYSKDTSYKDPKTGIVYKSKAEYDRQTKEAQFNAKVVESGGIVLSKKDKETIIAQQKRLEDELKAAKVKIAEQDILINKLLKNK